MQYSPTVWNERLCGLEMLNGSAWTEIDVSKPVTGSGILKSTHNRSYQIEERLQSKSKKYVY